MSRKVDEDVLAGVATHEAALEAMTEEIRARMTTPAAEHLDLDEVFGEVRDLISERRRTAG